MKVYKTNTEPSRYVFSSYIVMLCVISVLMTDRAMCYYHLAKY